MSLIKPVWPFLVWAFLATVGCPPSVPDPPEVPRFLNEKQEDRIDCRMEARTAAACSSTYSCKVLMTEQYSDCMLSKGYVADSIKDHMTDRPMLGAASD